MRIAVRALFVFSLCLVVFQTAQAQKRRHHPAVRVQGIYENFTVGKESGDLEGMRVIILQAGGDSYHAIVQIAQGGAADPEPDFVDAAVTGANVQFKTQSLRFIGTATATRLRLKDSAGQTIVLRRKPCSSMF